MSPIVHGTMYPETFSSRLLRYHLRILFDPAAILQLKRTILDLDTLRVYLKDAKVPLRIDFLLPAQGDDKEKEAYEFGGRLGCEILQSRKLLHPAVEPELEGLSDKS